MKPSGDSAPTAKYKKQAYARSGKGKRSNETGKWPQQSVFQIQQLLLHLVDTF